MTRVNFAGTEVARFNPHVCFYEVCPESFIFLFFNKNKEFLIFHAFCCFMAMLEKGKQLQKARNLKNI